MRHNEKSENIALPTFALLTKANEDAVHWTSPLKQWESLRCVVLIVDPTPSSLANPFIFKDWCLGGYNVDSVVSDSSGLTPRANRNERDASSEQRREKRG